MPAAADNMAEKTTSQTFQASFPPGTLAAHCKQGKEGNFSPLRIFYRSPEANNGLAWLKAS